jgi:uncharacterized protein YndB with AHSA1/START domain
MERKLVAHASVTIDASRAQVWDALVTPSSIKQYMFGTDVVTDWREGSPIAWRGKWQGRAYEDRGIVLKCEAGRLLCYTHFSPLSGLPDEPENYHTVTVELTDQGDATLVSLAQDNNATEQARAHAEKNWTMMLDALKQFVEGPR